MSFALDETLEQDTHFLTDWPLCRVLLMDDATYPWLILVPRRQGVAELIDLPVEDQQALIGELDRASRVLVEIYRPHKINIAALGNQVRQLHFHVIARQTDDPAWPKPVWGAMPRSAYTMGALEKTLARLGDHLGEEHD